MDDDGCELTQLKLPVKEEVDIDEESVLSGRRPPPPDWECISSQQTEDMHVSDHGDSRSDHICGDHEAALSVDQLFDDTSMLEAVDGDLWLKDTFLSKSVLHGETSGHDDNDNNMQFQPGEKEQMNYNFCESEFSCDLIPLMDNETGLVEVATADHEYTRPAQDCVYDKNVKQSLADKGAVTSARRNDKKASTVFECYQVKQVIINDSYQMDSDNCDCYVRDFVIDRKKTRSMVCIQGGHCLARALAVNHAFRGIDGQYLTMRNGDMGYRTSRQKRQALTFIKEAHIPVNEASSLAHLPVYEKYLNTKIIVFGAAADLVVYVSKENYETRAFLYFTPARLPRNRDVGHFDFISRPGKFLKFVGKPKTALPLNVQRYVFD